MSMYGQYNDAGFVLVPMPQRLKGPQTGNWNEPDNLIYDGNKIPDVMNAGLCHMQSGTCAIDIDDYDAAIFYFTMQGVDLQAIIDDPNNVKIHSGNPGHFKLIFRVSTPLLTKQYKVHNKTVFELRCKSAKDTTMQDVLPPSIHPSGTTYEWVGDFHNITQLPDSIFKVWQGMLAPKVVKKKQADTLPVASWGEVESAVNAVDASCDYHTWLDIAMALCRYGMAEGDVERAINIFDEWSSRSKEKYPGREDIVRKFHSIDSHPNQVEIGTLFHHAVAAGWRRPPPSVEQLFSTVQCDEPIGTGLTPKPPPHADLSVLPPVLHKRVIEVSQSVGCDPIVPTFAGLSAACAVADARSRLELAPGFTVPPILWTMVVGSPSDKKSPGSRPMFTTLTNLEKEDLKRYAAEVVKWEGLDAMYQETKKSFLTQHKDSESMLSVDSIAPPIAEPVKPVSKRLKVTDITSQKLVRIAADRPEGVLCHLDEMAGWANKLVRSNSGEDRSSWIAGYEASPYALDRVGTGSTIADNFALSIFGNLQPNALRAANVALGSDGLLQRFIMAPLHSKHTKKGKPVPAFMSNEKDWDMALRYIHTMPETTYYLSKGGLELFDQFQDWYHNKRESGDILRKSDNYMTALGKTEGLAGRLILVFHLLTNPMSTLVDDKTVENALDMVTQYLIPALDYTYDEICGDRSDGLSKWITSYLLQICDQESVTMSQIRRSGRRQIEGLNDYQVEQIIREEMHVLQSIGWVRLMEDKGRSTVWAINPQLQTSFRGYREKYTRVRADSVKADSLKNWRALPKQS